MTDGKLHFISLKCVIRAPGKNSSIHPPIHPSICYSFVYSLLSGRGQSMVLESFHRIKRWILSLSRRRPWWITWRLFFPRGSDDRNNLLDRSQSSLSKVWTLYLIGKKFCWKKNWHKYKIFKYDPTEKTHSKCRRNFLSLFLSEIVRNCSKLSEIVRFFKQFTLFISDF